MKRPSSAMSPSVRNAVFACRAVALLSAVLGVAESFHSAPVHRPRTSYVPPCRAVLTEEHPTEPRRVTAPRKKVLRRRSAQQPSVVVYSDSPTRSVAVLPELHGDIESASVKIPSARGSSSLSSSTPSLKTTSASRRTMQRPAKQHSRVVKKKTSKENSSVGLTRQEEIQFSFHVRTLRAAIRLRDQLVAERKQQEPTGPSVADTEWAKACGTSVMDLRRILYEGQQARTALCSANVGLVTSIAKRHYQSLKYATEAGGGVGTILTLQDMIQEGNLGLMEAAERFEPEKGFRFSTYATWWIRQRILRSISDSSRTIRLPAHVHGMLQKVRKAKKEMRALLGGHREPTQEELARHLDMSEDKLHMYTESSRNVVSLELPVSRTTTMKEDRRTLGDTLASDAPTPIEDAEADYLRRDVRHVMDTELSEKERDVIVQRFGFLEDGKPRTVRETAAHLGITIDRVRLLEARALNKLRHPQRNYRLKEYVAGGGGGAASSVASAQANGVAPELAVSDSPLTGVFHPPPTPRGNHQVTPRKNDRIWFF